MTLSEVETRLRDATYYAEKVRYEQGEFSQAFRNVQRDIQDLTALRNRMLADIEYRNSYQPQSMGYSRQSAYSAQTLQHPNSLAKPYESRQPSYSVPVFGSNDEANNKYSSRAEDKPRYTIEYPVGNSEVESKKASSKPLDGHEYEPIVAEGLEAKKEENGDTYKWEIYGKAINHYDTVTSQELPKEIVVFSTAQLFCKKNNTCCASGVMSKKFYIAASEGDDSAKYNEMFKSNILDALIKLYGTNPFIFEYICKYFTDIYNNALIGGIKRQQWVSSLLEDMEAMQEMVEKDPARKRAYMENTVNEINKDLETNISCKLTENILELNHNIPFIYVDDTKLLGNLLDKPRANRYSLREDSNPELYKVIKSYLKGKNKSYVVLCAMDEKGEVMKFDITLDIYGNYIIRS